MAMFESKYMFHPIILGIHAVSFGRCATKKNPLPLKFLTHAFVVSLQAKSQKSMMKLWKLKEFR